MKYGIFDEDSTNVEEALHLTNPIQAELGKLKIFDFNPEYDVLVISVISPDLHDVNSTIKAIVPGTETFGTYDPHVTVCYLKKNHDLHILTSPLTTFFQGEALKFDCVTFSNTSNEETTVPLRSIDFNQINFDLEDDSPGNMKIVSLEDLEDDGFLSHSNQIINQDDDDYLETEDDGDYDIDHYLLQDILEMKSWEDPHPEDDDSKEGKWVTVHGHPIFIKNGQSESDAQAIHDDPHQRATHQAHHDAKELRKQGKVVKAKLNHHKAGIAQAKSSGNEADLAHHTQGYKAARKENRKLRKQHNHLMGIKNDKEDDEDKEDTEDSQEQKTPKGKKKKVSPGGGGAQGKKEDDTKWPYNDKNGNKIDVGTYIHYDGHDGHVEGKVIQLLDPNAHTIEVQGAGGKKYNLHAYMTMIGGGASGLENPEEQQTEHGPGTNKKQGTGPTAAPTAAQQDVTTTLTPESPAPANNVIKDASGNVTSIKDKHGNLLQIKSKVNYNGTHEGKVAQLGVHGAVKVKFGKTGSESWVDPSKLSLLNNFNAATDEKGLLPPGQVSSEVGKPPPPTDKNGKTLVIGSKVTAEDYDGDSLDGTVIELQSNGKVKVKTEDGAEAVYQKYQVELQDPISQAAAIGDYKDASGNPLKVEDPVLFIGTQGTQKIPGKIIAFDKKHPGFAIFEQTSNGFHFSVKLDNVQKSGTTLLPETQSSKQQEALTPKDSSGQPVKVGDTILALDDDGDSLGKGVVTGFSGGSVLYKDKGGEEYTHELSKVAVQYSGTSASTSGTLTDSNGTPITVGTYVESLGGSVAGHVIEIDGPFVLVDDEVTAETIPIKPEELKVFELSEGGTKKESLDSLTITPTYQTGEKIQVEDIVKKLGSDGTAFSEELDVTSVDEETGLVTVLYENGVSKDYKPEELELVYSPKADTSEAPLQPVEYILDDEGNKLSVGDAVTFTSIAGNSYEGIIDHIDPDGMPWFKENKDTATPIQVSPVLLEKIGSTETEDDQKGWEPNTYYDENGNEVTPYHTLYSEPDEDEVGSEYDIVKFIGDGKALLQGKSGTIFRDNISNYLSDANTYQDVPEDVLASHGIAKPPKKEYISKDGEDIEIGDTVYFKGPDGLTSKGEVTGSKGSLLAVDTGSGHITYVIPKTASKNLQQEQQTSKIDKNGYILKVGDTVIYDHILDGPITGKIVAFDDTGLEVEAPGYKHHLSLLPDEVALVSYTPTSTSKKFKTGDKIEVEIPGSSMTEFGTVVYMTDDGDGVVYVSNSGVITTVPIEDVELNEDPTPSPEEDSHQGLNNEILSVGDQVSWVEEDDEGNLEEVHGTITSFQPFNSSEIDVNGKKLSKPTYLLQKEDTENQGGEFRQNVPPAVKPVQLESVGYISKKEFSQIKDVDVNEPVLPPTNKATGVVLQEPDGKIWIRQPKGNFGGYKWSFAKGQLSEGLSPQQNAHREVYQEMGFTAKITGYVGDFYNSVSEDSSARMYLGERTGGDPQDAIQGLTQNKGETTDVKLVTLEEAAQLLNMPRDLEILAALKEINESKKVTEWGSNVVTPQAESSDGKIFMIGDKVKYDYTKKDGSKGDAYGVISYIYESGPNAGKVVVKSQYHGGPQILSPDNLIEVDTIPPLPTKFPKYETTTKPTPSLEAGGFTSPEAGNKVLATDFYNTPITVGTELHYTNKEKLFTGTVIDERRDIDGDTIGVVIQDASSGKKYNITPEKLKKFSIVQDQKPSFGEPDSIEFGPKYEATQDFVGGEPEDTDEGEYETTSLEDLSVGYFDQFGNYLDIGDTVSFLDDNLEPVKGKLTSFADVGKRLFISDENGVEHTIWSSQASKVEQPTPEIKPSVTLFDGSEVYVGDTVEYESGNQYTVTGIDEYGQMTLTFPNGTSIAGWHPQGFKKVNKSEEPDSLPEDANGNWIDVDDNVIYKGMPYNVEAITTNNNLVISDNEGNITQVEPGVVNKVLKEGDRVITNSGVVGTIEAFNDPEDKLQPIVTFDNGSAAGFYIHEVKLSPKKNLDKQEKFVQPTPPEKVPEALDSNGIVIHEGSTVITPVGTKVTVTEIKPSGPENVLVTFDDGSKLSYYGKELTVVPTTPPEAQHLSKYPDVNGNPVALGDTLVDGGGNGYNVIGFKEQGKVTLLDQENGHVKNDYSGNYSKADNVNDLSSINYSAIEEPTPGEALAKDKNGEDVHVGDVIEYVHSNGSKVSQLKVLGLNETDGQITVETDQGETNLAKSWIGNYTTKVSTPTTPSTGPVPGLYDLDGKIVSVGDNMQMYTPDAGWAQVKFKIVKPNDKDPSKVVVLFESLPGNEVSVGKDWISQWSKKVSETPKVLDADGNQLEVGNVVSWISISTGNQHTGIITGFGEGNDVAYLSTSDFGGTAGVLVSGLHKVFDNEQHQQSAQTTPPNQTPVVSPFLPESAAFQNASIKDHMFQQVSGKQGSNEGGLYKMPDGTLNYVKWRSGSEASKSNIEHLANAVYKALGLAAPESKVIDDSGKSYYISKIIPGSTFSKKFSANGGLGTQSDAVQLLKGFAADCLLSNWDVLGNDGDNVLLGEDGVIYRIDNGGSLLYRGLNGKKKPNELKILTEWDNFQKISGSQYPRWWQQAGYSTPLDIPDIKDQIQKIVDLRKSYGNWTNFVKSVVPNIDSDDLKKIVDSLESKTSQLMEKVGYPSSESAGSLVGVRNFVYNKNQYQTLGNEYKKKNVPITKAQENAIKSFKSNDYGSWNQALLAKVDKYGHVPQLTPSQKVKTKNLDLYFSHPENILGQDCILSRKIHLEQDDIDLLLSLSPGDPILKTPVFQSMSSDSTFGWGGNIHFCIYAPKEMPAAFPVCYQGSDSEKEVLGPRGISYRVIEVGTGQKPPKNTPTGFVWENWKVCMILEAVIEGVNDGGLNSKFGHMISSEAIQKGLEKLKQNGVAIPTPPPNFSGIKALLKSIQWR